MEESSPPAVWRRPSDKDQDRLGDPLDNVVVVDALAEHLEVVGAGAVRGVVLHKLMEEFLTGELDAHVAVAIARAQELLGQLLTDHNDKGPHPDPTEMARCALRVLELPEIAAIRSYLVPEVAIWSAGEGYLVAGRADALAIMGGRAEVAIDWKSDVNPTAAARSAYAGQLRDYLAATGAEKGLIVFLTLGEIVWIENHARSGSIRVGE